MNHVFTDPDLIELDRIWPTGQSIEMRPNGVAVVAGAYKGRYIRYLADMFPSSRIVGYEPQPEMFKELQNGFSENHQIELYCAALGTSNRIAVMGLSGTDGASLISPLGKKCGVNMLDVMERIQGDAVEQFVDVMVLNMEGYEWALIPYMLDEMAHHLVRSLVIQFHPDYVSNQRATQVFDYLGQYYKQIYADANNWTHWKRLCP